MNLDNIGSITMDNGSAITPITPSINKKFEAGLVRGLSMLSMAQGVNPSILQIIAGQLNRQLPQASEVRPVEAVDSLNKAFSPRNLELLFSKAEKH